MSKLPINSTRPSQQQRIATRTGHGRLGLLKPKLTTTISQEALHGGRPKKVWKDGTSTTSTGAETPPTPDGLESLRRFERKPSIGKEQEQLPPYESLPISQYNTASSSSSTSATPRIGSGYRPSDIVANARQSIHQKASPSTRSGMKTSYTHPPILQPHPPPTGSPHSLAIGSHVIPLAVSSPSVASSNRPVLSAAISDQAIEALTNAQLRSSGLRSSGSATKLLPYQALAYPSTQQREQQSQSRPILSPPGSLIHPPSVSSDASFETVLRGPLTPQQQRALFEAGGTYSLDLLTSLSALSKRWKGLDELLFELSRKRQEESNHSTATDVFLPTDLQDRLLDFFASDSCKLLQPRSNLTTNDLMPLYRSSGRALESILIQLNLQGYSFPSPMHLAQATGSFTIRALLHLLILQPLVLPTLFHINPVTQKYESETIGWREAVEWFEYGYGESQQEEEKSATSASSSSPSLSSLAGPDVVTTLQSFAETRQQFRSVEELRIAMRVRAGEMKQIKPSLRPNLPYPIKPTELPPPIASFTIQHIHDFFSRPECAFFPHSIQSTLIHSSTQPTTELSQFQQLCQNDIELCLFYLNQLERAFDTGTTTPDNPPRSKPYFQKWSDFLTLIRRIRAEEDRLRAFLTQSDLTIGGIRLNKLRPKELAQLNMISAPDQIIKPIPALEKDTNVSPHPLIPILLSFTSPNEESFPSFSSLLARIEEAYQESYDQCLSDLNQMLTILQESRGTILHTSCIVNLKGVDELYQLCQSSLDTFAHRFNELIVSTSTSSTRPLYKSLTLLGYYFRDLNLLAEEEKKQLYHLLHSPTYPLWTQRGGGIAIYTQVTQATIDQLLKYVGPSVKQAKEFLHTLLQTKTRLKSAQALIDLAREQCEIQTLIHSQREQTQQGYRQTVREYFKVNWSLFEQDTWPTPEAEQEYYHASLDKRKTLQLNYASKVLASISNETLDTFLEGCGMKLLSASSDQLSALQTILLCLNQLKYLRKSYRDLDSESHQSSLVADVNAQSTFLKQEKRLVLKWLQNMIPDQFKPSRTHASTGILPSQQLSPLRSGTSTLGSREVSSIGSQLTLLPPSIVNSLMLQDMDDLFHQVGSVSSLGFHTGRVLKELLGSLYITSCEQLQDQSPNPAAASSLHPPFSNLSELIAFASHYASEILLPYRTQMQEKLLAILDTSSNSNDRHSLLLPTDFIPSIESIDSLLDVHVLSRACEMAMNGQYQYLMELQSERVHQVIQTAGVSFESFESSSPLSTDSLPSSSLHTFLQLQAFYFQELIIALGLLDESQQISCETLADLSTELLDFHSEQIHQLKLFLHKNESEIFDSTHGIEWDSNSTNSYLSIILSNFSGQTFLFERFYERILQQQQQLRRENAEILQKHDLQKQKQRGQIYHSNHVPLGQFGQPDPFASSAILKPLPKKHGSLSQFLNYLETLLNQQRHVLKKVQEKVLESGLIQTTTTDSIAFTTGDASSLLELLHFISDESLQLDVCDMMLLTLGQRFREKDEEIRQHNQQLQPNYNHTHIAPFTDANSFLQGVTGLIANELNELCQYLTVEPGSSILSITLQHRLSDEMDVCERLWASANGSVELFKLYVQEHISTSGASLQKLDELDEFLLLIQQMNSDAIEKEFVFKSLLFQHQILHDPSNLSFLERPNRLSLQKVLELCRELGSMELNHTIQLLRTLTTSSTIAAAAPLSSLSLSQSPSQPFNTIHDLIAALQQQVAIATAARLKREQDEKLRREAEEAARIARELEEQRLEAERLAREAQERAERREREIEREDLRQQLREYLLTDECPLFGPNETKLVIQHQIRQPSLKTEDDNGVQHDDGSSSPHVLDQILNATRSDLTLTFRTLDAVISQGLVFDRVSDLIPALRKTLAKFEVNAAELITWMKQANQNERILPNYIMNQTTDSKEGAELLLEFDKDAQIGCEPIQQLLTIVVDQALILHPSPAFTSFALLVDSMRHHRSSEMREFHAWLETASAAALFEAGGDDDGLSATEGELQRLLLSAPSWKELLPLLQTLLAQGRTFPTVSALTDQVREEKEVYDLSVNSLISWIEFSSGLFHSSQPSSAASPSTPGFTLEEEMKLRDRIRLEGMWRVQNEVITIQQQRTIELAEAIKTGQLSTGSTTLTLDQLLAQLSERRQEALASLKVDLNSAEGHRWFPHSLAEVEYSDLLLAVIDPSLLLLGLDTLQQTFTDVDSLLLSLRRFSYQTWLRHLTIQRTIQENDCLKRRTHFTPILSYFDTSYLLSLIPSVDELIATFASERFKKKEFLTVELLVNAVVAEVEWREQGMKSVAGETRGQTTTN